MGYKLWFDMVCVPNSAGDGMNCGGDGAGDSGGTVLLEAGGPLVAVVRLPVGAFDIYPSAGLDGIGSGGDDLWSDYRRSVVLRREDT